MNERTGKVAYEFKRPFRDGSTHVALDPMRSRKGPVSGVRE